MASALAIITGLALVALFLTPIFIATLRPAWSKAAALATGLGILAVGVAQTGWLSGRSIPSALAREVQASRAPGEQCPRVIALLEEARVIVSRANPSRPEIDGRAWESLPPSVRELASSCLERGRPAGAIDQPFEIVLRPAG